MAARMISNALSSSFGGREAANLFTCGLSMPGQKRSELEDALNRPRPPPVPLSSVIVLLSGTYCKVCIGVELRPSRVYNGDEV